MDSALLVAQIIATCSLASWLTLGVRDNLLHPSVNETYTAEVMNMTRMRLEYPAEFAQVAHRAIADRRIQLIAFRLVIGAELLTTLLLWLGTIALLLGLAGAAKTETAQMLALYGASAFVAIWSAFLIVGNHFCYWLCHEGAQNTHFQMTLWGLATVILLAQGS